MRRPWLWMVLFCLRSESWPLVNGFVKQTDNLNHGDRKCHLDLVSLNETMRWKLLSSVLTSNRRYWRSQFQRSSRVLKSLTKMSQVAFVSSREIRKWVFSDMLVATIVTVTRNSTHTVLYDREILFSRLLALSLNLLHLGYGKWKMGDQQHEPYQSCISEMLASHAVVLSTRSTLLYQPEPQKSCQFWVRKKCENISFWTIL